jgi:ABC-type multidrug transport system ATPase subunit
VSTQHIEEAERLSDRILMIADGKGVLCDSPANIKNRTGLFMRILCQKDSQESKYDGDEKSE